MSLRVTNYTDEYAHSSNMKISLKLYNYVLTSVAQLIGCQPVKWKVAGSIPIQGTCLGCGQVPGWGSVTGSQLMFLSQIDVFLPLFLPPSPSL